MKTPNATDWGMLFRFDDQSESFCHGWEMGALWERIHSERSCDGPYLAENVETIIRMAQHFNLPYKVTPSIEGWVDVVFPTLGRKGEVEAGE